MAVVVPPRVEFRRKHRALRTAISAGWICVVVAAALVFSNFENDSAHHHHMRSFDTQEEVEGGFSLLGWLDGPKCSSHMPRFVALFVWVAGVLYTFLAIAIVCDDFFVASLEAISEALDLSEDVAGATFMAAGSSAPELFSSITGVFFVENVKEDNVGPGTIVGSAVFNIAIIVGASVICAGKTMHLDWWPLARDSSFYLLSIIVLFLVFAVITPRRVDWFEGLFMVILYAMYIVLMKFNPKIVDWLNEKYGKNRSQLVEDEEMGGTGHAELDDEESPRTRKISSFRSAATVVIAANRFMNSPRNKGHGDDMPVAMPATENEGGEEEDEDEAKGPIGKALWVLSLPILFAFKFTIPNCATERWKKWYMASFLCSVLWIAVVSYFMVEFGIKMGHCLGLSSNVMALTVLAAGTSVPDALSSIAVAKQGKGDMAVANALGSNVFDILLGLGLPWFISGAMVRRTPLPVNADGIMIYVFMLILVLVVFLGIVRFSGWSISPRQGIALCCLYPIYCVLSLGIDKGLLPVKHN